MMACSIRSSIPLTHNSNKGQLNSLVKRRHNQNHHHRDGDGDDRSGDTVVVVEDILDKGSHMGAEAVEVGRKGNPEVEDDRSSHLKKGNLEMGGRGKDTWSLLLTHLKKITDNEPLSFTLNTALIHNS